MKSFNNLIDDYEIEDNVLIKLFVQSLDDIARYWYKSLPDGSMESWDKFQRVFREAIQ